MPSVKLHLLGSPRLTYDGEPVSVGRRKAMAILAILAVSGEPQTRDHLLALLWPDYDTVGARTNLRRDLSYLRRVLGGAQLIADRNQVWLDRSGSLWVDVHQFHALLEETAGEPDMPRLAEATSLYVGDLMTGFGLPDAPAFDEWLFFERESLRRQQASALQALVTHYRELGTYKMAIDCGRRWLALDPLQEAAHRELMRLYAWSGQQAASLRQYDECVRLLDEELGVPPEDETVELFQLIKQRRLEIPDHLALPEGSAALPETRVEVKAPGTRQNLPAQGTTFLGRAKEVAALTEMARNPEVRLATIVGPGGIGKTRLSLAVAEELVAKQRFTDGVYFVPLAPLDSAGNIASTIAESLDFRFHGEEDSWQQLLNYLGQKQMLLVLDNFEHLLPGGASQVAELLQATRQVKLLATSREPLHLTGESVYRIIGLSYPEAPIESWQATELAGFDALALLLQQARLRRPGQEPDEAELVEMARICQLVQGMPLALVLAAGWLEMLSFREIGDEIANNLDLLESENRDLPLRQRSVRAAFSYSWQQLSRGEQKAFMKLAVFRGGFSRWAAGEIAGTGLRVLRALIEKSLLTLVLPERFEVHELLRQFVAEKLAESGYEVETRNVHSVYYLQALTDREVDLKGRRQVAALAEIDSDFQNILVAWKWATQQHEETGLANALHSLALYLYVRGRHQEGVELLHWTRVGLEGKVTARFIARLVSREILLGSMYVTAHEQLEDLLAKSLATAQHAHDLPEIAFSYLVLGIYDSRLKYDYKRAQTYFETSLTYFEELNDYFHQAWALGRLGYAHSALAGGLDALIEFTLQGLALARQTGSKIHVSACLLNLGSAMLQKGELGLAKEYLEEAVPVSAETGYKVARAQATVLLSLLHLLRGELARAKARATEALVLAKEMSWRLTQAYALAVLSLNALLLGDSVTSDRLGREGRSLPSNPFGQYLADWALTVASYGLAQYDFSRQHFSRALATATKFQWPGSLTWLLPVAALFEDRAGQASRSLELLALAMHHPQSASGWVERWTLLAKLQSDLQHKLGPGDYQAAWERGKALDLEATMNELLARWVE